MSEQLTITITAKDGASQVFRAVGSSATQMGQAIDKASSGGKGFDSILAQVKELDSEITSVGQAMTGLGAVITGAVAVPMIAGTTAAWNQVRAVQQATVALSAYEKDASKVEQVLSELVAYARSDMGVLFQREDLFKAAQGLKVMGAETENLVEYVEIMSRAVGLGTVSWDELNMVIGRVLATGRLAGNEFDELTKAGFQLDASLRNTNVTADELFDALGRGIPADAMLGQIDTIDGQIVRFQSSIRALGVAFLQIDADTSEFIEGGLGDRLYNGIGQAREAMLAMVPAAAAFGSAIATAIDIGVDIAGITGSIAGAFLDLPGPVGAAADALSGLGLTGPTAAAALTGLSGVALLAGGSLLLLVPRIAATVTALKALNAAMGASGVIGALRGGAGAFGVWGAAATVATVAVGGMVLKTREMINASEDLNTTLRELRLEGLDDSADQLEAVRKEINGLIDDLGEGNFDWLPFGTGGIEVPPDIKKGISEVLTQAVTDSRVDYEAFFDYIRTEIASLDSDEAKIEFLREISDPDILIQFRSEVDATRASLEAMGALTMSGLTGAIADLRDGEAALENLNDRATTLTTTLDDLRIDGDIELASQLGKINDLMQEGAESSDAYLDAQDRISGALADGKVNYQSVAAEITRLNEEYARTGDIEAYEAGMISLSQNLANYTEGSRNSAEATAALNAEFIASALAIAGYDNALSQLNMTGMTGDVGLFAEEWTRANQAMDNTFRVIVGNTNAIIQQVDGIQSWADSLIGVRGELGEIDQLLEDGFIDKPIYDKAQDAYDRISVSIGNIRGNLLAVQAIQAPWIAEVVAGTERWAAELRSMPEDVQRTTLAFMDMQTVTQAQELITLGNSAAFDEMGASGRAAFEATIQGALQVNPLLFDVLKTMGIIEGTPLDFEVDYSALEGAGSEIEKLTTSVTNLVDTLREIHNLPPIAIDTNVAGIEQAQTEIEGVLNTVQEADGTTAYMVMTVNAETGELEQTGEIIDSVLSADGKTANVTIETTGGEIVQGVIDMATGEITMTVNVDVQMSGAAELAGGSLANLRGMLNIPETITTTVDVTGADSVAQVKQDIESLSDTTVTVSIDVDSTAVGDLMELLGSINDVGAATVTVDVVIGTNELDTGLAGWGLGTGGGGGGAAGYEGKTVTVDVLANTDQAAEQIAGLMLAVNLTDITTITVDADVSAAETAISGLTESDTPVTVMVDANVGQAKMRIDGLSGERAGDLVTVMVDADTSAASEALLGLAAAAQVASSMAVSIPTSTPGSGESIGQLQAMAGAAAAADALSVAVPVATPGSGAGIGQLQAVAGAAAAADAMSVSIPVSVSGAGAAIGALNDVASAAANANRTVTITTYYQTVGSPARGSTYAVQHGGIPELAHGGITARMAEAGAERLHFAGGGTALVTQDSYYTVPPMTYVSPANVGHGGGDTYHFSITVEGNVIGIDDLAAAVTPAIMQGIVAGKQRRDLAKGLTV